MLKIDLRTNIGICSSDLSSVTSDDNLRADTSSAHAKMLVVSAIELFLNHCICFYDRQFITRDKANIHQSTYPLLKCS